MLKILEKHEVKWVSGGSSLLNPAAFAASVFIFVGARQIFTGCLNRKATEFALGVVSLTAGLVIVTEGILNRTGGFVDKKVKENCCHDEGNDK